MKFLCIQRIILQLHLYNFFLLILKKQNMIICCCEKISQFSQTHVHYIKEIITFVDFSMCRNHFDRTKIKTIIKRIKSYLSHNTTKKSRRINRCLGTKRTII